MQYRGGMLPDQWPTEVQKDIAAVRGAVVQVQTALLQDIAADIDAVRVAVQAVQAAEEGTTRVLLQDIAADLEAIRAATAAVQAAVEATAQRDVWLKAYRQVGSTWTSMYLHAPGVWAISVNTATRTNVSAAASSLHGIIGLPIEQVRTLLEGQGMRFVVTPAPTTRPGLILTWLRSLISPQWRQG